MNPNKVITVLGVIQIAAVILGFFALGITMKMNGYPRQDLGIKWNGFSIWLRSYGFLFMLIPIVWILVVSLVKQVYESHLVIFVSGTLSASFIVICFIYAAIYSYSRPFFINL